LDFYWETGMMTVAQNMFGKAANGFSTCLHAGTDEPCTVTIA
jgi:hypothetical protein